MNNLLIAIVVMIGATMSQHLGLVEAIEKVVRKIVVCPMCFTFWSCIIILLVNSCNPIIAMLLSLTVAYFSNWFVIVMIIMQQLYDRLWQKVNKQKR